MISVAICDDEREIISKINQVLSEYQKIHKCTFVINDFTSGESLCESKVIYDLIFLDIEMCGIDGIKTAKLLRLNNRKTRIVYVTSHSEYAVAAYSIHPFEFIEKPVDPKRIFSVLDEFMLYYEDHKSDGTIIEFKGINGSLLLDTNDIYVFEYTSNRRITVFTKEKSYVIKGGISEIFDIVDKNVFTSPHKSFIINMTYVNSLRDCIIYMTNNIEVPVAQKKLKEFKKELSRFIANYIIQE